MARSRPRSLYSKVLAFVSASTLASSLVVSWIAIESRHADLRARLEEQLPRELAQQEALLAANLSAAGWTLAAAVSGSSEPALANALEAADRAGLLGLEVVDSSGAALAGRLRPRPAPQALASELAAMGTPRSIGAPGAVLIAVGRPIAGTSTFLVGGISRAQAYAPLRDLALRILVVDLCLVVLFTLLAQRITLRILEPVHALSRAARRVSRGHLDVEIDLARKPVGDEIGILARAFEHMLRRLRTNQREIERSNAELRETNSELRRANEVLSQLSVTDGLTKLHNHRYFQDLLTREVKRADRVELPLSLMLIDIDDFKQLNDRYGHAAGDQILGKLSEILNERVRETDVLARYGGEEFAVLSPSTELEGATLLAEQVRLTVEQSAFHIEERPGPLLISVSIGVAQYEGNAKRFFRATDAALYRAKDRGKNCVVAAEPGEATG